MSKKLWEFISLRKFLFILGEGVLIYISVIIATHFLWNTPYKELFNFSVFLKVLLITLIVQISLYFHDLYEIKKTDSLLEIARRVGYSFGVACIALSLLYYFYPPLILGRGVVILSLFFLAVFLGFWRVLYGLSIQNKLLAERTLLLGTGKLGQDVAREIIKRNELSYNIISVATTDETPEVLKGLEELEIKKDFEKLYKYTVDKKISTIIVAFDERRGKLPIKELLECKVHGVEIVDGINFYENITGKLNIERINPSWLIFSEGFSVSLTKRMMKRSLDLLCAVLGLIVLSPILLATAILIKLESRGPIFFTQERVGRGEVPFVLYKFRSMRVDAEEKTGPVWASQDDPRVTRIGKILRKLRIDEIPQLWNVLKGEMSIVGPRPEREFFVKKLEEEIPYYSQRFAVKPGCTGWAQILHTYGSSVEDAAEKLRLELYYIKNTSILMDVLVILATFKIIYLRRGQ